MSYPSIKKTGRAKGDAIDTTRASFPKPPKHSRDVTSTGHKPKKGGSMIVQSPSTNFAKGKHGHTSKLPSARGGQNM